MLKFLDSKISPSIFYLNTNLIRKNLPKTSQNQAKAKKKNQPFLIKDEKNLGRKKTHFFRNSR
jgi:hypothetical protein